MKYNTLPGEDLGVIGSIEELGMWDQNKALKLGWTTGNVWKTKINYNFTRNNNFEFKFIFISNGRVKQWEDGSNRKINYEQLKELIEPNMKEINWGLKDQLRNELIRREQNHINQNQRLMMTNNKERNGDNLNMNNKNEKAKNVDEILAKIKERKKIEVVNDIKKQLFPTNLNNNIKIEKEEKCDEKDIYRKSY